MSLFSVLAVVAVASSELVQIALVCLQYLMGMIHVAVFSICFCIVVGFELNIRECGTNDITTNPGKISGGTKDKRKI